MRGRIRGKESKVKFKVSHQSPIVMVRIRVMGQAGVRVTIRVMQGSGLQSR